MPEGRTGMLVHYSRREAVRLEHKRGRFAYVPERHLHELDVVERTRRLIDAAERRVILDAARGRERCER